MSKVSKSRVIEISRQHPRYFVEGESGKTWIPVGCNLCFDRLFDGAEHSHAAVRSLFEKWIRAFAANGGNCIRLWAGHKSLEVMPEKPGEFDPETTKTFKMIIALCEKLNIKVKITLESFRKCLSPETAKNRKQSSGVNINHNDMFNRRLYAPYAKNLQEFYKSEECFKIYLAKAKYLKSLGFGDSPAVYCWELWNEINSTAPMSFYASWSDRMLKELKKLFPRQLTVQNLGSFSGTSDYQMYDQMAECTDNDFMQVHRYLDSGASLDACRGAMDVVAASATREMLLRRSDCPAIVAEIGAVQANHAGPFPYYLFDKQGVLLHDALFGAFFAGAAGCGQFWHWDHQYIDGLNLWWHFKRFARAIKGLDPVAEKFKPFYTESRRLKMYGLKGKKITVVWCRDKMNSWIDELVAGNTPETLSAEQAPFNNYTLDCYLPWEDKCIRTKGPALPPFQRSLVFRVSSSALDPTVRPH